jgi:tetratricopeptide (TPR) repeat protein
MSYTLNFALGLIFLAAFANTSRADDAEDCAGNFRRSPDLDACTRIVTDGRADGTTTADAYVHLGDDYKAKGQFDRAFASYVKAAGADPTFTEGISKNYISDVYRSRGYVSYLKGDYPDAIAEYDRAIALNPDFALAFADRAYAYRSLGNDERAAVDLAKALALRPAWSGHLSPKEPPGAEPFKAVFPNNSREFLLTRDRAVSVRYPGASVSLTDTFDEAKLRARLPGYTIECTTAPMPLCVAYAWFDRKGNRQGGLDIYGDLDRQDRISAITGPDAGPNASMDDRGVAVGTPLTRVYSSGFAKCSGDYSDFWGMTYWCQSKTSGRLFYNVDLADCYQNRILKPTPEEFKLRRTKVLDCMIVGNIAIGSREPR